MTLARAVLLAVASALMAAGAVACLAFLLAARQAGPLLTTLPVSVEGAVTVTAPATMAAPATAPESARSTTSGPPAGVSYDPAGNAYPVPACTAIGGTTMETLSGAPSCSDVAYLGTDGQVYYTSVPVSADGTLAGPAQAEGTAADESECATGTYPDGAAGPVTGPAGRWDTVLALCLPPRA
jgi:hypothetical protein